MNVWARCECSVYVDTLCDSVVCVCVCMWYASMTVYMVTGAHDLVRLSSKYRMYEPLI